MQCVRSRWRAKTASTEAASATSMRSTSAPLSEARTVSSGFNSPITTGTPRLRRLRTTEAPMNPAPPVTRNFTARLRRSPLSQSHFRLQRIGVFADARRGGGAMLALAVNANGGGRGSNRGRAGAHDGLKHVEPTERFALEEGWPVHDLRAPDVERLHPPEPIGGRLAFDVTGDRALDFVAPFEAGLGGQAGDRGQVERLRELVERRHGDGDKAVAGRIDAVGRGEIGVRIAERRACRNAAAVVEIGGQHLELEVDERFEETCLDVRACPRPAAPHQRGEHALNDRPAREQVRNGEAERHRALVAVAVQPHEPGARLREQVLPGKHRPWAFFAVAGDGCVDNARVDRLGALVVEPQPFDDAGTEVLDDHVGLADEAFDGLDVGRILEIGGEAELAAVDGVKKGRVAANLGVGQIEAPAEIAPIGPLDLDHPRAQIAEAKRRERPRQELAHIENDEPLKQSLAHPLSSTRSAKAAASRYFTVCRCSQYMTSSPSPLKT